MDSLDSKLEQALTKLHVEFVGEMLNEEKSRSTAEIYNGCDDFTYIVYDAKTGEETFHRKKL